jgi:hypothetical protein
MMRRLMLPHHSPRTTTGLMRARGPTLNPALTLAPAQLSLLLHRLRGVATRALALLATALLLGCGPGVGGTGLGSVTPEEVFGAQALSVCDGALASALACGTNLGSGGTGGTAAPTDPLRRGTAELVFSNSTQSAHLLGNSIRLLATCQGLSFTGDWGAVAGAEPRFFGRVTFTTAASTPQQWAQLLTSVSSDGQTLTLRLLNTEGEPLLPPVVLVRQAPAPAAPTC